ncbi:TPA: hypothetical protein NJ311_003625 [Vibrio parahaemolyticus]|nr:hypothetical protein [Vibrio parahaemolyticus]
MKKILTTSTLCVLTLLSGISTQALAMSEQSLINLAKQTEFNSCGGKTLEQVVDRAIKKPEWSATDNPTGGKSVTIQGHFKKSGALMGMQFKINDDESLRLRIMLVNGMVKSQDDSLIYFTKMCKGQSL